MNALFRIAFLAPVNFEQAHAILSGLNAARPILAVPLEIIPLHYSQNVALHGLVAENRIDGIIGDLLSDRWVESLHRDHPRLALVHIGGQSELKSVSTVGFDEPRIGALAAGHFIRRHYRRLFFAGLAGDAAAEAKAAGFVGTAAAAGLVVSAFPPLSLTAPPAAWDAFVTTLPSPAAVFCQDDSIARRVIACCRRTSIAIPDAVSIIGTGNSTLDSFLAGIGISSIETDYAALGTEGARRMADVLRDPAAAPAHVRLPPKGLVLRDTTGIGGGHSLVGRAIDFMEKHLADPIRIEDIARYVNTSRRLLELRFKETLDRSPHTELTRLRMTRAAELLENGQLSITAIGEQCGYPERAHFDARFRQFHHGITPAAWRQRHA